MAKGILIAAMNFSDVAEDEFHDWYDTEHIAERLAVPGFLNAERWIGINNPKDSVALYDLDNVGVLHSPPYLACGGALADRDERRARARERIQRMVQYRAPAGAWRGARRPRRAALSRHRRDAALRGDLSFRGPQRA